MATLDDAVLRETADRLISAHEQASRTNEWTFFVDEIYAQDCVYTCLLYTSDAADERG